MQGIDTEKSFFSFFRKMFGSENMTSADDFWPKTYFSGMIPGSFWDHPGIIQGHFWAILTSFLEMLGTFLDHFWVYTTETAKFRGGHF